MLSYQHAYHAGNIADLHKHASLVSLLRWAKNKPQPISYFETHSGRAFYNLEGEQAVKTGEAAQGYALLADQEPPAALAEFLSYQAPKVYWGSPGLAGHVLDKRDKLELCELHPREAEALSTWGKASHRVTVHQSDGYAQLRAFEPAGRGFVLIDPSYELKGEYQQAARQALDFMRRCPMEALLLWYPMMADKREQDLLEEVMTNAEEPVLWSRLSYKPLVHKDGYRGMVGSGVLLFGPGKALRKPFGDVARALASSFQPHRPISAACSWL